MEELFTIQKHSVVHLMEVPFTFMMNVNVFFPLFLESNSTQSSQWPILFLYVVCPHCIYILITDSNILENSEEYTTFDIIHCNQTTVSLNHCSFFGNSARNAFIFFIEMSITFRNCYMSDDQKTSKYGSVAINTASESFIKYYEYSKLDNISFKIF